MTGATCWLSAARLACTFCVMASDARAGFAASADDAFGIAAADNAAEDGASSDASTFDEEDALADAESSAPQPLNAHVNAPVNAHVASATKRALTGRLSLLMSASGFVKADAVSNPFKK